MKSEGKAESTYSPGYHVAVPTFILAGMSSMSLRTVLRMPSRTHANVLVKAERSFERMTAYVDGGIVITSRL